MAQDARREFIPPLQQLGQPDRFAALDPFEQPEIGGRVETEIVRILAIDALEALR